MPLAFAFADTTAAKVANTVAVLAAGRRYWAPRRYESYHRGITALDYGRAAPVVVTTFEQLQEHGAETAVWRRLGRTGEQTLTAAFDNPDGDALYRPRPPALTSGRHSGEPPSGRRSAPCTAGASKKFTDERWEETTARGRPWTASGLGTGRREASAFLAEHGDCAEAPIPVVWCSRPAVACRLPGRATAP
ncbi:hypothetical protein [Streptomyces sp. NPDC060010]|uniref:hypothetical protein n=1 Tax=Streptomyces sp. NPDC060010 TaxID=3347036 RepID=UPI003689E962